MSIKMGRMRPKHKASVVQNEDAEDAQAEEGKRALGSPEEAAVVSVDEENTRGAQAKGGKPDAGSVDKAPVTSQRSKCCSLPARSGRSGVPSGNEEDPRELQEGDRTTAKAKGKGKDRSLKVFRSVEDVEDEIARLKKPPRQLKKHDFKTEFALEDEGENPHHFRKNTVPAETLRKLFGKPYGESGRAGYAWGDCDVQEVVHRVRYLHPILYQHGEYETPNLVTIRFAEGVALEYEEGCGRVNWCAFGEETNKRQRSRYTLDRQKLEELKKAVAASITAEGKKKVDVRGKEWRGFRVDHGVQVKTEGDEESSGKKRALVDAAQERGNAAKSRRLSTAVSIGDCDGAGKESGMASGLCVPENGGGAFTGSVIKKSVLEERLLEVQQLMEAIHLEQQCLRELKKEARQRLEEASLSCKQSDWGMLSFQKQEAQKKAFIKTLQEAGKDTFKETIKMEGIQELMEEEAAKVKAARVELGKAEAAMASLTRSLENSQLQFDALAAEKFQLTAGRSTLNCLPWPMVYSPEDPPSPSRDFWDDSRFIRITACSLCSFPFPQSDIVVSSCKHLYHPFCASVVFSRNCKCVAEGCFKLSHPAWHRSFGWGEPDAELSQRELTLGLAEERKRIMKDRIDQARSKLPAIGKFTFQLRLCLVIQFV